jgi:A/G-specific adenine glycosylase
MLQQTQVDRVIPFYKQFIKQFPTAKQLAAAPLSEVLTAWQGLGYNRRAKLLHEAVTVMQDISFLSHRMDLIRLVQELEKLPGVGPYTARAVAAFAYNADVVFVETNVRTAIIHHFYPQQEKVSDKEIEKVLEEVLPIGRAREWYSALMDYGAYLKRSGVKVNARSKHYAKQAKFEGSLRQTRGAILKALTTKKPLANVKKDYPERFDAALAALAHDKIIKKKEGVWSIM